MRAGTRMSHRILTAATLLTTVVLGWMAPVAGASSAEYPSRPIRLVVPYAPGGPTDVLGRIIGQRIGEVLGQPVVVDNRPGAGGTVGITLVSKAPADGYTLLVGDIALSLSSSLYKNLAFDPATGFAPIGLVGSAQLVLWVRPDLPVKNLQELIALAKQKPGKLSYASAGVGNTAHLVPELVKAKLGLDILHVPYKGTNPGLTDVAAGHVDMIFTGLSAGKPYLQGDRVRALAITGSKRAEALPGVPTFAEEGAPIPELDVGSWWGLLAPAGTAREVVIAVNRAIESALQSDQVKSQLAELNITPLSSTPQQFGEWIDSEAKKWAPVIRRAGIEPL